MKNKKKNKVVLLIVLLLGISVGYALLSTTLKINGTSTIAKNTWSIYWANPVVTEGSVTTTLPTIGNDTNGAVDTVATWSTTLSLPGDFYEFTIDAVNNGSIDAMITDIEDTVTPELPSYIKYEVTYEDGKAIAENHLLAKKNGSTPTTEKYKVRVEFLDTITPEQMEAIPEGGVTYTFNYAVTYGQATADAVESHPIPVYYGFYGSPSSYTSTTPPSYKRLFLSIKGDEISICINRFGFVNCFSNEDYQATIEQAARSFEPGACETSGTSTLCDDSEFYCMFYSTDKSMHCYDEKTATAAYCKKTTSTGFVCE